MANGDRTRANRTVEQWLIEIELQIAELKMEFYNFREMRRQAAHMEARFTDKAGQHTLGDTRPRSERQRKPR